MDRASATPHTQKLRTQASSCGCFLHSTLKSVEVCVTAFSDFLALLEHLLSSRTIQATMLPLPVWWNSAKKLWCFAPDKSQASNKTPDQARPNYTVVAALLPLETLQSSYPAVYSVGECVCKKTFQMPAGLHTVSLCAFAWQTQQSS